MLGKKIVKNAFLYKVKKNYFINLIKRDKSNLPQAIDKNSMVLEKTINLILYRFILYIHTINFYYEFKLTYKLPSMFIDYSLKQR